ncbi:exonuclease domain-containing protein [Streptomyces kronopolitis]|uniref:exonuclease domain-containing protein n=1 Tax=Streptomyces kronopolitis TaxID=1612435 RepID=UPI003D973B05
MSTKFAQEIAGPRAPADGPRPIGEVDGVPVFADREAPPGLMTVRQLAERRLKVAAGQAPAAYVRTRYWYDRAPLYSPAEADKMRPLSALQLRQMTARRTCPKCGDVRRRPVHGQCADCVEREQKARQALEARTCQGCRRVAVAPYPRSTSHYWSRMRCLPCRMWQAIRSHIQERERWEWMRTCPGWCEGVTATDEEIARALEENGGNWSWRPRWCPPCDERREREREEAERRRLEREREAREARERQVRELEEWAAAVLADPSAVILDTETTGLHDSARIVEISVLTVGGVVLVDTLVNPGEPIPADASAIHEIYDADVAAAPTFGEVLVQLTAALDGRRLLIYNAPYDRARLQYELTEHYRAAGHDAPEESAAAWLAQMRIEDAMVPYSDWVGEYSEYWGNYRWQALDGGHRALSDCRAVVERLKEMASVSAVAAAS